MAKMADLVIVVMVTWCGPNHSILEDFIVLIVKEIILILTVETTLIGIVPQQKNTIEMIRSIVGESQHF
jgi:hypothetical protein